MRRAIMAGVLVVSAAALLGCSGADPLVNNYCVYGAKSQAQLEGCREHVMADEVRRSHSNAARWARRGGRCLADAGPFCELALEYEAEQAYEASRECETYQGRRDC